VGAVEDIDQLLVAWQERLKRVDDNLLALEAEPTYEMLSGTGAQRAPLDGVTKERVYPALNALSDLFEHRERLTEVLDRAKEIRASVSALTFWNTDEKLHEVKALLHGPSIKLATTPKPLAQRHLLDPAAQDVAVVPEQLLGAMAQAFDVARTAVMEVKRAWETLEPAIEQSEREASGLRMQAAGLGVEGAVAGELEGIERELAAVRTRIARDPLGVAGSVTGALAPRLADLAARLAKLGALRDRVGGELARAKALVTRLEQTHTAAMRAKQQGPAEVDEASCLPQAADGTEIEGLSLWLAKLEGTARAGRWQAAEVGVARWFEAAQAHLAKDRAVKEGYEGLVALRAELQGRLSARRAQAQALAARGTAVDASAEEKAREAEGLLKRRPTPLEKAAALVDAYEAAVVSRARK
jgi:hypothetical protein